MFIRKTIRVFALLAIFATLGLAAACSSDDDDEPSSTGSASTGAATGATGSTGTTGATGATGSTGATDSTGATGSTASTGSNGASEGVDVALAEDGDLGSLLVGPDGRTLYVFLRDTPGASNCTGNCLDIWPPLLLEDGQEVEAGDGIDGEFASIDTPSGTQVTYNDVPLYYFASDAAAGETKGNLVGNVWFVARTDTASTSAVIAKGEGDDAYLVGPTGLTLYFFDNDTEGVSNCTGTCLENWPAITTPEGLEPTVDGADGEIATITRDDGMLQITYNGLPLYYYVGDSLPGDTNGDGVGGVWTLATP